MHPAIARHRAGISTICQRYRIRRLDVFGSAADGTFDASRSDLDFLVTFLPEARRQAFDNYFDLKDGLAALFGRPIDLVTADQIKNPYLRQEIESSRRSVYAA